MKKIYSILGLITAAFLLSLSVAMADSIKDDDLLHLTVGQESGFLPHYNNINIKFSSIDPSLCKMAPCPQTVKIAITKENILNKKANILRLSEGESKEIYGIEIKLVSIQNNTSSFLLTNSKVGVSNEIKESTDVKEENDSLE